MSQRHLTRTAIAAALITGLAMIWPGNVQSHEFNLAKFRVDDGLPKSLTGKPGDAAKGKKTAVNRKKGNCLACHVMPIANQPDHGDIGPPLGGVAGRLTVAEMRLRLVDPKVLIPDTIMPSFYRDKNLFRVQKKWQNKTILSAQEVEDIIAYLVTLK